MSGVSLPVSRPAGRALLVGSASCRADSLNVLSNLGFQCTEADHPYAAMAELARRPLVYWALIVSLQTVYREELLLISSVKRRWPHVEVWLTHTDGRQAALAEAMRLGADGLLSADGLHRTATSAAAVLPVRSSVEVISPSPFAPLAASPAPLAASPAPLAASPAPVAPPSPPDTEPDARFAPTDPDCEPVLTAEELRALLGEPTLPADFELEGD